MLLLFALTVCGLVLAMNVSLALTWQLVRLGLNGAVTGHPFTALPGVAVMACGSLGWLGGRVLKADTSRQREFLADVRAVQFTRSKDGLGCMLRKVAGEGAALSPRQLNPAVQHMLLVGAAGGDKAGWLAAHPPLSERIRRIYGRPMPPMPLQRDAEPTRSGALF